MIKCCYKCDTQKDISAFCKNRTRKDGLADQCRECDSARKRKWRKSNPSIHLEQQRLWRSKNRDKVRAIGKRSEAKLKEQKAQRRMAYRAKYPERMRANRVLAHAVEKGLIKKNLFCQSCGAKDLRLTGHHADYSEALNVIWVCGVCHSKIDELRADYLSSKSKEGE